MIYLTFNDPPSGIYSGQVIDVCRFLNTELNAKIRLVSLISLRGFWGNRKKIKAEIPDAVVLPMFPGPENWRLNVFLLFFVFLFFTGSRVIARGPFAASLALKLKKIKLVKRVCFDARGAYDAEFNEYQVAGAGSKINLQIFSIEQNALLNSDFRIAVSDKLVAYWKEHFGYVLEDHTVIPCTLSSEMLSARFDDDSIHKERMLMGFSEEDVVCVYSGSSSGWQSFELIDDFMFEKMNADPKIKALFLVDKLPIHMKIMDVYSDRVVVQWIEKEKVHKTLQCCDYGLLLRKASVTNKVSSPVKFAEYLAAGLQVIISDGIGDYTDFVKEQGCGIVIGSVSEKQTLEKVLKELKNKNASLATAYFLKKNHSEAYNNILSF